VSDFRLQFANPLFGVHFDTEWPDECYEGTYSAFQSSCPRPTRMRASA